MYMLETKINKMKTIISNFLISYVDEISREIQKIDEKLLSKALLLIETSIKNHKTIFVCGNGGSAAISNHYVSDYLKLIRTNTKYKPKVISLSSNHELISAISNDINYSKIFSYQLETLATKGDLLILISSSGNSKNIVNVVKTSKKIGLKTLGFSGFKGGYLNKHADCSINLNLNNYGQSEDSHHILMHVLMQYFIKKHTNKNILRI